ncbi:hypothetical protein Naga_100010g82 [Nannochloropsis gaditana]|uniref:Uncharacterized protein n=1 Tax=Nannochloropsis gaditana TaxID=72520 RepID=W7TJC6_9STRA|nr:hypothetical protein Naga_100010g82 [Nannochloropsis gaditana]
MCSYRLVQREELVTCATINRGHDLDIGSIARSLERPRASDSHTPRGRALLETLKSVMEYFDHIGSPPKPECYVYPPPIQCYGKDTCVPFYSKFCHLILSKLLMKRLTNRFLFFAQGHFLKQKCFDVSWPPR